LKKEKGFIVNQKTLSGTVESVLTDGVILCDKGDRWFLTFEDLEGCYILPPRKGGKEARDIVAMLASLHRKTLKGMMKCWIIGVLEQYHKDAIKDFWARRKRKDEFILRSSGYIEYKKAKSMLK